MSPPSGHRPEDLVSVHNLLVLHVEVGSPFRPAIVPAMLTSLCPVVNLVTVFLPLISLPKTASTSCRVPVVNRRACCAK
jgi:hypothetical protein